MKWITREHVKVDRVACPWLIRKFIDPQADLKANPVEFLKRWLTELPDCYSRGPFSMTSP